MSEISSIVVSSDSEYMLSLAKEHGVEAHQRPVEYCDERTKSFGEVVRYICSNVSGEHILWATCTSPLVYPALYSQAIVQYECALREGYDSLISVRPFKEYLWDENGPINYQAELKHVPSQQLPDWNLVTNGIFLLPRECAVEWAYFFGRNPYKFKISKFASVDIDDELDLLQAEAWLNSYYQKFEKTSEES